MSRIDNAFARARENRRAALVTYLCAGDPDWETSLGACRALLDAGADILELGVPFSDPLADGPANQQAAQRALEAGATQESVFELVAALRKDRPEVPIALYTYYNLVFSNGVDAYVDRAKRAGIDALLVLDLPPEEAGEYMESCARREVGTIFLLAPTTPPERAAYVAAKATGFVYYVSRAGVTGVREDVAADLESKVAMIRRTTSKPLVVGFGIARREHVSAVARLADGVVVGSALVNVIKENLGDRSAIEAGLKTLARDLVKGLGRPAKAPSAKSSQLGGSGD